LRVVAPPPTSPLRVVIDGFDLPGRTCAPSDAGEGYRNVHVGVQRGQEVVDLVPGDAPSASWSFQVTVKHLDEGPDFGGPFVHGRRGDRFVYLSWGVADGDSFEMFRRAKLLFADVDPQTLGTAVRAGALHGRLGLTDSCGNPVCARVRPPDVLWTSP